MATIRARITMIREEEFAALQVLSQARAFP
jgi:hypothetical protein